MSSSSPLISETLKQLLEHFQAFDQNFQAKQGDFLELLKNLANFLQTSSEQSTVEITNFLEQTKVHDLIEVIEKSKKICDQQQQEVLFLSTKVSSLSEQMDTAIDQLDLKSKQVVSSLGRNSSAIEEKVIELIAENIKTATTDNLNSLFLEAAQKIRKEIEEQQDHIFTYFDYCFRSLKSDAESITSDYSKELVKLKEDVNNFNSKLKQAFENINYYFSKVEKMTQKNIDEVYKKCEGFQDEVAEKMDSAIDELSGFFSKKVDSFSQKSASNFDENFTKIEEISNRISKKVDSTAKILEKNCETSLGLTQKTIEKQTNYYEQLSKRLNFNYFSINTSSILAIILVFMAAVCITTFVKNQQLNEENQQLEEKNKRLHEESILLQVVKKDTVDLTKLAINDLKKKFPDLEMTLNCKALD